MELEIRYWREQDFVDAQDAWQNLLEKSNADPLFNSWTWMYGWWQSHRRALKATLCMIAFYRNSVLVGIAPLYVCRVAHRGFFRARRVQILGTSWRHSTSVFSEYSDLIADRDHATDVVDRLGHLLMADKGWSDLVVANAQNNSLLANLVRNRLQRHCYVREVEPLVAYSAKLPAEFESYAKELDSGVRRKVWNHRSKLVNPELRVRNEDVEGFFNEIDVLHAKRWGRPHYDGITREFNVRFALAAAKTNQLNLTELRVNGELVSLMYNIRIGRTEYNIQSAFDDSHTPGVSLGYLHLGYAMEKACKDGISDFDLLGGTGKSRNYKRDFKTTATKLVCFQAIRPRLLSWMYRAYEAFGNVRRTGVKLMWAVPIWVDPEAIADISELSFGLSSV